MVSDSYRDSCITNIFSDFQCKHVSWRGREINLVIWDYRRTSRGPDTVPSAYYRGFISGPSFRSRRPWWLGVLEYMVCRSAYTPGHGNVHPPPLASTLLARDSVCPPLFLPPREPSAANAHRTLLASIFLAYDVSDHASFERLPHWLGEVRTHAHRSHLLTRPSSKWDSEGWTAIMLGLRSDLEGEPRAEGEAWAAAQGLRYAECSSKTGAHTRTAAAPPDAGSRCNAMLRAWAAY